MESPSFVKEFTEEGFREYCETLSKEELISLVLYWKRVASNYYWRYWKLYKQNPHEDLIPDRQGKELL